MNHDKLGKNVSISLILKSTETYMSNVTAYHQKQIASRFSFKNNYANPATPLCTVLVTIYHTRIINAMLYNM